MYLPSFEFRYRQELTQNSATLGTNALHLLPEGSPDYDQTYEDIRFRNIPSGRTFTFRTKYQYGSLTWPVTVSYEDSTSAYWEVRFGVAGWTYSRMYVTQFPQVSTKRPVVYDARTNVLALRMNTSYLKRRGVRVRLNFGLGIGDVRSPAHEESLDTLFEPAGGPDTSSVAVESSNVVSGQLETAISYRLSLFPNTVSVNMVVEPGLSLDYSYTKFNVFDEETLQNEDASDKFTQGDVIFLPWVRFSFGIN